MVAAPVNKDDVSAYKDMKLIFEKSTVAGRAIKSGSILTLEDLAFKKPGDGIPAADYKTVIGKMAKANLPADHKFVEDDFA